MISGVRKTSLSRSRHFLHFEIEDQDIRSLCVLSISSYGKKSSDIQDRNTFYFEDEFANVLAGWIYPQKFLSIRCRQKVSLLCEFSSVLEAAKVLKKICHTRDIYREECGCGCAS